MKKIVFAVFLILTVILLGKNLNPFSSTMFDFHDMTQPARIQEFTLNLQHLKIPPRLSPDLSHKLGYPVFNFYAPTAYWIGGLLRLSGIDTVNTLKLSFLLAIILAFWGTYLFLNHYFSWETALLGGVAYVTSIYIPVSIFVRGNLGELWFMALLPLIFHLFYLNSQKKSGSIFFATVIAVSFSLTAHNLLSLAATPLYLVFILLQKQKKRNMIALVSSLLLGSYFFLPLILENSLTYAKEVATATQFSDHFLCWWQLWQSPWGYGGSAPGCFNDGMTFKLGKPQIIFGLLGIVTFIMSLISKRKGKKSLNNFVITLFFLILSVGSLFLTIYQSQFIWRILSPLFSLFQFPWRFIAFSLIGVTLLGCVFFDALKIPFKTIIILIVSFLLLIGSSKYFYKPLLSKNDFTGRYLSKPYIEQKVAYDIAEYLPKTASYTDWRKSQKTGLNFDYNQPAESSPSAIQTLINQPFEKEFFVNPPTTVMLNIHYFPFWKIIINNISAKPSKFDRLGRPIFQIKEPSTIRIIYDETPIEKLADIITVLSFIMIVVSVTNKKIWNRIST